MKTKSFALSVLVPLAALLALVIVLAGCDAPTQPSRPNPPNPPDHGMCERPKLLAFTASWCGPCQRSKPVLAEIEARGVDVRIIDIDEQPGLARQFNITAVPTFILYVCGRSPVRTSDVSVVDRLTHFGP